MALKVKFLKTHLKWKEGDPATLDNTQARYLERMHVVQILDGASPEQVEKTLTEHLEKEKKVVTVETENKIVEPEKKKTKTVKSKKEIK